MPLTNIEIAGRASDAFNRRDAAAFKELFAPDAEIVPMRAAMEGTVYRGPDAAERFFAESDETWRTLSVEVDELEDLGDLVLASGVLRGRGRSSGAEVGRRLAWVVRIREGLITSFRTYLDPAQAREDAGLSD